MMLYQEQKEKESIIIENVSPVVKGSDTSYDNAVAIKWRQEHCRSTRVHSKIETH